MKEIKNKPCLAYLFPCVFSLVNSYPAKLFIIECFLEEINSKASPRHACQNQNDYWGIRNGAGWKHFQCVSSAQPSAETVKYYCLQKRTMNAGQSPLLLKKKQLGQKLHFKLKLQMVQSKRLWGETARM